MSRKANIGKVEELAGKSIIDKLKAQIYGDKFSSKAATLIDTIQFAIELENGSFETKYWPGVSNPTDYEKIRLFYHNKAWRAFSKTFNKARSENDGQIFRDIANVIELSKKPIMPERAAFGSVLQVCHDQKLPLPTPSEMRLLVKQLGFEIDLTTVGRFEKYYEVTLPRAKRGRK